MRFADFFMTCLVWIRCLPEENTAVARLGLARLASTRGHPMRFNLASGTSRIHGVSPYPVNRVAEALENRRHHGSGFLDVIHERQSKPAYSLPRILAVPLRTGTITWTVVDSPGAVSTRKVPPIISTRSFMPSSPRRLCFFP